MMEFEDVRTVGVVGGGTMGFGIAINFALNGYSTVVSDLNQEVLDRTQREIGAALDLFVEEDFVSKAQAAAASNRIELTTEVDSLARRSDFVTEAIVERLADKQALFETLDRLCPAHTILVSNTSGFLVSEIGASVKRQEQIGLTHYFAPPHIVPGVEVAKAPGTSDQTYDIIYRLMEKTGKVPIRVLKERPGYLLNRIQGAAAREALRLWAEGVATAEDLDLGVRTTFGFRMPHEGPLMHYDVAGIWKWPSDAGRSAGEEPQDEVEAMIQARMAERRPWFVDPDRFDEAIRKRDREYIRRLKALYGR